MDFGGDQLGQCRFPDGGKGATRDSLESGKTDIGIQILNPKILYRNNDIAIPSRCGDIATESAAFETLSLPYYGGDHGTEPRS